MMAQNEMCHPWPGRHIKDKKPCKRRVPQQPLDVKSCREVSAQMEGRWDVIYQSLLASPIRGAGQWRTARCPLHDDTNPSFSFNVVHGGWRCHAGCGSGDTFTLIRRLYWCTFPVAVAEAARLGGLT